MNGSGNNIAGAVRQQAALASVYDRLVHLTDRVDANAETTAITASRAIGPTPPSAPSNSTTASAPQGDDVASKFGALLTKLEQAIDRQGVQNNRLNDFV